MTTSVVVYGVKYNCRGIVSDEGTAGTQVQHGTKCGNNKVCNNKGTCHCDVGWAPPFCKTKTSSFDSGHMIRTDTGSIPKPAVLSVTIMAPALIVPVLAYFLVKVFMKKAKIASARSLAS
ncbi:disintegrin and metalloproteinase domain-containing protein 19-like isoform X2 [Hemiscyllium ocellatum]|nr:disintegrin and metalloproteinase domain-containing protein 19-like isoform X2 [Hemiscyllium ocellatum]